MMIMNMMPNSCGLGMGAANATPDTSAQSTNCDCDARPPVHTTRTRAHGPATGENHAPRTPSSSSSLQHHTDTHIQHWIPATPQNNTSAESSSTEPFGHPRRRKESGIDASG